MNSIDKRKPTTEGLLVHEKEINLGFGVQSAVAFHKTFGAYMSLNYIGSMPISGGEWGSTLDLGFALSYDINPVTNIPLGLLMFYQIEKPFQEGMKMQHLFGGGLFYTGRKNLVLGTEIEATLSKPMEGVSQLLLIGNFRLAYLW